MKKAVICIVSALMLSACFDTGAEEKEEKANDKPVPAREVILALFEAMKAGDVDRAVALTARFDTLPLEEVIAQYKETIERVGGKDIGKVVADKEAEQVAVVVVQDLSSGNKLTIDLDPLYLVKQKGEWKALLPLMPGGEEDLGLDEKTLAQFRVLKKWYETEKPKLVKQLEEK